MKYVFGGPEWTAFMYGMIVKVVAGLGASARDLNWSTCEVFTDPPAELSPDGSPLAWHCIIRDGEIEFNATECSEVDVKIVADYRAVLPLARFDTKSDENRAHQLAGMGRDLAEAGKLTVLGDRSGRDPRIGELHDLIARVTR